MRMWRLVKFALLLVLTAVLLGLGVLVYQGKQAPKTNSPYVALGASFAAGLGLGSRDPGSPYVCQRSVNGYPQLLAREVGLAMTDMTCSGATITHVLHGGQVFLGPQIDALGPDTRLVTLTAGGNDISYVGDLTAMAFQRKGGFTGLLIGQFWSGAKPVAERDFPQLQAEITATLREIRRRAPRARILVVAYPAILPEAGTCPQLGIDEKQAELMRSVALRLAEVTQAAASAEGATIIDMTLISKGHDACTAAPWVNGSAPAQGTLFHPTAAGARAVSDQIKLSLSSAPL